MLSSISPLGERARASRWWLTTTFYAGGSLIGGAAVGAVAALLGSLVPDAVRSSPWLLLPVAVALLIALALDLGIGGKSLPVWKRQVDVAWLARYRGWVYGLGFGAQLGFALATIVTSATTYAMVVFAALSGQVVAGLAIGAAFGATVTRAPELLHGKTSEVHHTGAGVLAGLPDPFTATRYHSLAVVPSTLPDEIEVTGRTDSGVVMAMRHRTLPIESPVRVPEPHGGRTQAVLQRAQHRGDGGRHDHAADDRERQGRGHGLCGRPPGP